jgi:hypothetical protein
MAGIVAVLGCLLYYIERSEIKLSSSILNLKEFHKVTGNNTQIIAISSFQEKYLLATENDQTCNLYVFDHNAQPKNTIKSIENCKFTRQGSIKDFNGERLVYDG